MTGRGFSLSLAIVFRVTGGMETLAASLAPVPAPIITVAPPLDEADPASTRLGKPVKLPGWTLDMPPNPMMKNDVLIGTPLTPPAVFGPNPPLAVPGTTYAPGKGITSTYP